MLDLLHKETYKPKYSHTCHIPTGHTDYKPYTHAAHGIGHTADISYTHSIGNTTDKSYTHSIGHMADMTYS